MNTKLALVLTAVLGFAVATVAFAQEAEQIGTANTEIAADSMENVEEVSNNSMEMNEEAPVDDSSAPATY